MQTFRLYNSLTKQTEWHIYKTTHLCVGLISSHRSTDCDCADDIIENSINISFFLHVTVPTCIIFRIDIKYIMEVKDEATDSFSFDVSLCRRVFYRLHLYLNLISWPNFLHPAFESVLLLLCYFVSSVSFRNFYSGNDCINSFVLLALFDLVSIELSLSTQT